VRHSSLVPAHLSAILLLLFTPPAFAQAPPEITVDADLAKDAGRLDDGRLQVLVELADTPAAVSYGLALRSAAGSRTPALDLARAAGRSQLRIVRSAQERVAARIHAEAPSATEIYRVSRAYDGIALAVAKAELPRLARIAGVRAIHPLVPEYPTLTTSVPFLGVPPLWSDAVGLGTRLTGAGVSIGILDTGIDYLHADFGGSGLLADYQANDSTSLADGFFPTPKVVGGTDFCGDAYSGTNLPVPDPDPMDCGGHGSHVAGIAAGLGVDASGATYTGPYGPTAPFASLRIGPGVAPQAKLYALRIFGCTGGGTTLVAQAIDWAIDPNGDDDFSDHLDVINISTGTNFGTLSTTTTVAAQNAALAGVIVAAAAGNSSQTSYIVLAPSNAPRAISVAASSDSGLPGTTLQINSPPALAGKIAALGASFIPASPDPAGETGAIVRALDAANASGPSTTDGCTALTNAAAVAGNIALIDRGACGFIIKAQNAQAAGAIGVIVAGLVRGDPSLVAMGGTAPPGPAVTIPAVFISFDDGARIKAQLGGGVNGTLAGLSAADVLALFTSRGPAISGPAMLKPDLTAPGVSIISVQTGNTCVTGGGCLVPSPTGFIPGSQSLIMSGTSMATPHVAGLMALLRQLHPDWTVEELKALAMNGSVHDLSLGAGGMPPVYGPSLTGTGRIDPIDSAISPVTAFNADASGTVSVTFDTPVVGTATQVQHVRVVNHGATAATYDLAIGLAKDAPGIAFSLPGGSSLTVPAGGTTEVDVRMDATASQMRHVRDPVLPPVQASVGLYAGFGNLARNWETEEQGYLTFSRGGQVALRVPLYMAARPASAMSAADVIATGGANAGTTAIALAGTDVCTGTLGAGPACAATTASPTFDEVSLVSPFELQAVSPRDPANPPFADIQYAGVAYDPATDLILFGVSTWGDWSTPTQVAFNVYVDIDGDGTYDRVLFNSNVVSAAIAFGLNPAAANPTDVFIDSVYDIAGGAVSAGGAGLFVNGQSPAAIDSALFRNNVLILAATPAQLGLPPGTTSFQWMIESCPGDQPLCGLQTGSHLDQAAGPFRWDYAAAAQGLNFGGKHLAQDLNGAALPVTWNLANLASHGSLGALLLHHHNAAGSRAEVVTVEGSPAADLAIAKSMAPPAPTLGQSATFTLTLSNAGPAAATGVTVSDALPAGLTYVSDDGGGAYDAATGQWTVGAVAVAGSATLHVVATVDTSDPVANTARISASTPLDPNPANDLATVRVMAPRAADLALAMSVGSPTVLAGNPVTYTLTVTNLGGDPAFGLDVHAAFPGFPLLSPASFSASQGVYDPATGRWNLASLGKGISAALAITVNAPNIAGPLTGQGTASASTSDPVAANNTASATAAVLSPAAVTATKTVAGSFVPGGSVTYTVVLSNHAAFDQQDNPGDEFDDVLPASLVLTGASASAGTATAVAATNTVTWNGSIPAGGSVVITIHAALAEGAGGHTVSNQGTVHFDADGNGTNESSGLTDDPAVGGAADPTTFAAESIAQVPALSTAGLAAFAVLLAAGALAAFRRRCAA